MRFNLAIHSHYIDSLRNDSCVNVCIFDFRLGDSRYNNITQFDFNTMVKFQQAAVHKLL